MAMRRAGGSVLGCRLWRATAAGTASPAASQQQRGLQSAAAAASSDLPPTSLPSMPPFSYTPRPYDGPTTEEILAKRKAFLNPAMFHYYKKPVNIVEGKMQYLFDETGRRYLDAFAGIVTVSVGHCHPHVVEAINQQNSRLQHITNIYLNHQIADYAEALAARMPGDLKVCYFVNSGSEANDMAMLMARIYTGNYDIIALRNAYHGMSVGTMGLTAHHTWKYNVPQGFGIKHAMNPDPYRGVFGDDGPAYVSQDLKSVIEHSTSGRVAGFIAETIQGVGGTVKLADGYLPQAYDLIRAHGGLCIADEVQTGFGRCGTHYWGFETAGVMPDIVTMAKASIACFTQSRTCAHVSHSCCVLAFMQGIGNGVPLAAVVTTREVAAVMAQRLHFNTYGGNPVCSAAGKAVLEVVDKEKRQEHCREVGGYLLGRLMHLQQKHDIIGDVRGAGLMLGVEMVTDRKAKTPATAETVQAFERMKDLGVLAGKGGLKGNVFRIKPPMCFTRQDADFFVAVMDQALSEL
eukprot:jgi/Chlat1/3406/Chrsp23S03737